MSFPRYEVYKKSGFEWLGEVPMHWTAQQFKRKCRLLTEKTGRRECPVGLENVDGWTGRFIESETDFEGVGIDFEAGDLLFGKLRPYLAKVYLAERHGEAVGDFHVIRADDGLGPRFAQYQMLTPEFIGIVDGTTFGSKMPRASWEAVGSMAFALPPVCEQQSIVRFLDLETTKIDALVAEQRRLIELLKEKRQAVISHAVTKGLDPNVKMKPSGIEWLGDVPDHWSVEMLARVTSKIGNGFVGPTRDILVESGVPYIQATHIKKGRVNFDGAYFVTHEWAEWQAKAALELDDVLIVQTGAGTGDVGLVSKDEVGFRCHALIIVRTIKQRLLGSFLSAVLQSQYGRQKLESIQTGGMHPHLNCGNVKFVFVPLPPPSEQQRIVQHASELSSTFDSLIAEAGLAITLLQERRTALISAAVTGKIDVRTIGNTETAA